MHGNYGNKALGRGGRGRGSGEGTRLWGGKAGDKVLGRGKALERGQGSGECQLRL